MFVDFDVEEEDEEEDEQTDEAPDIPFLFMLSEVHNPINLQLVNTAPIKARRRQEANMNLLCDEKLPVDTKVKRSKSSKFIKKSNQTDRMTLFKRRMRVKKFIEMTKEERESLANVVLSRQKSNDQSHFISHSEDTSNSTEAEFISIGHPVDFDYFENYSTEEASIHDLFDLDVDAPDQRFEDFELVESYIEEEHLEDDE